MIASFALLALTSGRAATSSAPQAIPTSLRSQRGEFEEGLKFRDDAAKARPRFREAARLYDELWQRGLSRSRSSRSTARTRTASRATSPAPSSRSTKDSRPRAGAGRCKSRWKMPGRRSRTRFTAISRRSAGRLRRDDRHANVAGRGEAIAALLWLFVCAGVARFAMTRAGRGWPSRDSGLRGSALLGGLWLHDHRVRERESEYPLVVVAEDVHLRKGNAESFPVRLDGRSASAKGSRGPRTDAPRRVGADPARERRHRVDSGSDGIEGWRVTSDELIRYQFSRDPEGSEPDERLLPQLAAGVSVVGLAASGCRRSRSSRCCSSRSRSGLTPATRTPRGAASSSSWRLRLAALVVALLTALRPERRRAGRPEDPVGPRSSASTCPRA